MINQSLSLLCDRTHCLKTRNYIPGVLRSLKVASRLGRALGLALLGWLPLSPGQCYCSWPGNEPVGGQGWGRKMRPQLLARAPQAAPTSLQKPSISPPSYHEEENPWEERSEQPDPSLLASVSPKRKTSGVNRTFSEKLKYYSSRYYC